MDGATEFFVDGEGRIKVADKSGGTESLRDATEAVRARAQALRESWRGELVAPLGPAASSTSAEAPDAEGAERLRELEHQGYAGK